MISLSMAIVFSLPLPFPSPTHPTTLSPTHFTNLLTLSFRGHRVLLCCGPLSSSSQASSSFSLLTRVRVRLGHDPVLVFYPSSHACARPPETVQSQSRTRERRYLLRGGRRRRDPSRTVRAARVRRAGASLRDFQDRARRHDAGRRHTATARSPACAPPRRSRSAARVCPSQSAPDTTASARSAVATAPNSTRAEC